MRKQIDGVLHDIALGFEIGKYVDGGVGDEQRLRMGRHIHDEDVTDPSRRAQARCRGGHRAHQLVRMQAALHQKLALALVDQRDGLCSRGLAVRCVHQLIASDVDPVLLGDGGNFGHWTDQNGNDDAQFRRLAQRRAARSRRKDGRRLWSPAALL